MVDDVDDEEYISVEDALRVLRDSSLVTRAPAIEDLVWRRISGYVCYRSDIPSQLIDTLMQLP